MSIGFRVGRSDVQSTKKCTASHSPRLGSHPPCKVWISAWLRRESGPPSACASVQQEKFNERHPETLLFCDLRFRLIGWRFSAVCLVYSQEHCSRARMIRDDCLRAQGRHQESQARLFPFLLSVLSVIESYSWQVGYDTCKLFVRGLYFRNDRPGIWSDQGNIQLVVQVKFIAPPPLPPR